MTFEKFDQLECIIFFAPLISDKILQTIPNIMDMEESFDKAYQILKIPSSKFQRFEWKKDVLPKNYDCESSFAKNISWRS
jgi:hypothetical protein